MFKEGTNEDDLFCVSVANQKFLYRVAFSEDETYWQSKIEVVSPRLHSPVQVYLFPRKSFNHNQVYQEAKKMLAQSMHEWCYRSC